MRNQASNSLLRILTRRAPSPGTTPGSNTPQHFKLSPSTSPSPSTTSTSTRVVTESFSKRALSSQIRNQTKFQVARSALAVEASSLRYALLLSGEGEEALLRGWDAGVAIAEEDDGTWVEIMMIKSCICEFEDRPSDFASVAAIRSCCCWFLAWFDVAWRMISYWTSKWSRRAHLCHPMP